MNLFSGYIPAKGKEPLGKIKDKTDHLSVPPESGDYVGVLKENIVQLDFDNEVDAKRAIEIVNEYRLRCDILETSRGVHLYFINDPKHIKTQAVDVFNACGMRCDIGLGCKDRVVPLRMTKEVAMTQFVDGEPVTSTQKTVVQRAWLQTYSELDVVPAFFRPVGKTDHHLSESTTRNQTLFNYILVLQSNGFTKEETRRTIKIINKYILKEPLDDKEIDQITRDDAFSEELFFEKDRFLHDRFGNYMLSNSNIMKIDGQVHIYTSDHLYSNDPMDFERVMLDKIPSLKESQRKEVYKYISLMCDVESEFSNARYIGLKDSILDIQTMEQFPYSPKWIINNRISYNYNPKAYHELMDKTLNKVACGDAQIRMLLEEMIGYTLYRKNMMQSAFILTGEGSNGKSTILNVIKKLLGKKNYTSLDLREMEDTFKPAELSGKLANIGDDISAKFLDNSSAFKKVVTGESFLVQKKYAQPFELESYATQIFCANELPQVSDKSDGFGRRLVIIPFNARFSKSDVDYDPFIEDKLLEEDALEYLLNISIEGLKRVLINRKFTQSDKGEAEKSEYIKSNNNVLEYLEEEPKIENESVPDAYLAYQVWCTKNGCMAVKKANFSKEIKKQLGLVAKVKSVDGKSVRVYVKE